MTRISLREKLILYFLVIGVFTIVTISWYAYNSGRKALISRTFDQLTSVRAVKQNLVEKYFADRYHDLDLFAQSKSIRFIGQTFDSQKPESEADKLLSLISADPFLLESFRENENILAIYFTSSRRSFRIDKHKGTIKAEETLASVFPEDQVKQGYLTREIQQKNPDQFNLLMGKIIDPVHKIIMGIEISVAPVNHIMIENDPNTGWGKSGESYLVGNDYLMKTPSRFILLSVQKTRVNTTAVTEGLSGNTGTALLKDYRGIDVLRSYCKLNIKGLHWVILAEIDLNEAMAPVNALRNEILFLSIFITSIVFLLALLLARSISRPVRILTSAAERIREGDYNIELKASQNDEIGSLTHAFNTMAHQIRQQSRARIDGQDIERQRLSRELHDGLGQWLVAARFRLESTDCSRPEITREQINETKKMVDSIIEEIRRISNDLMPGVLQEFGLETALHSIVRELNRSENLSIDLNINAPLDKLGRDYQVYLFRIIQEALNNIIKHAQASRAGIDIILNPLSVSLIINDNGKGFKPGQQDTAGGNGLLNMRERTHILNGEMTVNSGEGQGTRLEFTLPLPQST